MPSSRKEGETPVPSEADRRAEILIGNADDISILHLLDDDERRLIAPLFREVHLPRGGVFVKEGETARLLGIIVSGEMEVKHHTVLHGRSITIAILDKGSHVGDYSMPRGRPAPGSIVALEESELLVVSGEALDAFIEENPEIGVKILKGIGGVLAIRFDKAIDRVVHLS